DAVSSPPGRSRDHALFIETEEHQERRGTQACQVATPRYAVDRRQIRHSQERVDVQERVVRDAEGGAVRSDGPGAGPETRAGDGKAIGLSRRAAQRLRRGVNVQGRRKDFGVEV